jgi:hypothetical protein
MPPAGTYMAVGFPSFDQSVAERSFVYFTVVPASGTKLGGGGSNTSKVEVLDVSDTAVTIRVDYDETLSDGQYVVSGEFTVTRCP